MQPLVLQLQAECLDSKVPVLEVLRKALVVARKLSLNDARAWIDKELNGYKSGDQAPPYRIIKGDIQAFNPFNGWIPAVFQDPRGRDRLSMCFVGQAVGELENMVKQNDGVLASPFDPVTENQLMQSMGVPLRPVRRISHPAIVGVIDAVRTLILNWCMDLERDGILGENLAFTAREKETASHANYTINYHGSVGTSQVQQGTTGSTQSISLTQTEVETLENIMKQLSGQLSELALKPQQRAQVKAEIETVQSQLKSPSPSRIVLSECIRSVTNILEGCAGSILAAGLLHKLAGVPL